MLKLFHNFYKKGEYLDLAKKNFMIFQKNFKRNSILTWKFSSQEVNKSKYFKNKSRTSQKISKISKWIRKISKAIFPDY